MHWANHDNFGIIQYRTGYLRRVTTCQKTKWFQIRFYVKIQFLFSPDVLVRCFGSRYQRTKPEMRVIFFRFFYLLYIDDHLRQGEIAANLHITILRYWNLFNFDYFVIEVFYLWCDWREIIIGLDNGLQPTGTKSLSKPVMSQFSDAWFRHKD